MTLKVIITMWSYTRY